MGLFFIIKKKNMKKIFLLIISVSSFLAEAQVIFENKPIEKQLYGRDLETNYGLIKVSGYVNAASFKAPLKKL